MGMDTLVLPQELLALGPAQELPSARSVVPRVFALCRGLGHHSTALAAPCPWESPSLGPLEQGHWDWPCAWGCAGHELLLILLLDMTVCYQGAVSCLSEWKQPPKTGTRAFF